MLGITFLVLIFATLTIFSTSKSIFNRGFVDRSLQSSTSEDKSVASIIVNQFRGGEKNVEDILDPEQFESILAEAGSDELIVVDFYATWCPPCQKMAPVLEEMAMSDEYSGVKFVKVNVDNVDKVPAKYQIMSMPTFVFIKNQEVVDQFSGASVEKLVETIAKYK